MKRLFGLILGLAFALQLGAATTTWKVTTWNLEWFPSGKPDFTDAKVEAERTAEAAKTLRSLAPDIILLQEVRDEAAVEALAKAIGQGHQVIVTSRFTAKDKEGVDKIGQQQQAILAKFPAKASFWQQWETFQFVSPPRGFAFALFDAGGGKRIAVYSLHLKSNGMSRDTPDRVKQATLNRMMRELAAQQVVRHLVRIGSVPELAPAGAIVGGDFNTDPKDKRFAGETTHSFFLQHGFANPLSDLPLFKRITLPADNRYPDVTFDYLLFKNTRTVGDPQIVVSEASDHRPVTYTVEVP